jgi:hypothetical protein
MHRALTLVIALAVVMSACSGGDDAEAASTTSTSTPPEVGTTADTAESTTTSTSVAGGASGSSSSTTTTTEAPVVVSPLNGLPVDDEALLERRVMAVKVDNHPQARPQSGIQEADAVVEILVEGSFTRFMALFHHSDSEYLGPIRSGRPTDPGLLQPLGATITVSGAQDWVAGIIVSRGIPILGEGNGTFRIGSRSAPHNLYGSTIELRAEADARGYPDDFGVPLYEVAPWDGLPEEEADTLSLTFAPGTTITWTYEDGKYHRWMGGFSQDWIDAEGAREQISADVLVVLGGSQYTAYPPSGAGGSPVPATETTGSGWVLVFTEGRVAQGTWTRATYDDPFTLLDDDGAPLTVPPGHPWISVFPSDREVSWSAGA